VLSSRGGQWMMIVVGRGLEEVGGIVGVNVGVGVYWHSGGHDGRPVGGHVDAVSRL